MSDGLTHPAKIVHTPGTCGGRARLYGHRICVWHISQHMKNGMSRAMICHALGLRMEQVDAALRYALNNPEEILKDLEDNAAAWVDTGEQE